MFQTIYSTYRRQPQALAWARNPKISFSMPICTHTVQLHACPKPQFRPMNTGTFVSWQASLSTDQGRAVPRFPQGVDRQFALC